MLSESHSMKEKKNVGKIFLCLFNLFVRLKLVPLGSEAEILQQNQGNLKVSDSFLYKTVNIDKYINFILMKSLSDLWKNN